MKQSVKYRVYELDREDPDQDFGSYMFLRRDEIRSGQVILEFPIELNKCVSLDSLLIMIPKLVPDGAGPREILWPREDSFNIWYRDVLNQVIVFELDEIDYEW